MYYIVVQTMGVVTKGEILEIEDFVDEIENLIVGIEIVDYVQKEW